MIITRQLLIDIVNNAEKQGSHHKKTLITRNQYSTFPFYPRIQIVTRNWSLCMPEGERNRPCAARGREGQVLVHARGREETVASDAIDCDFKSVQILNILGV